MDIQKDDQIRYLQGAIETVSRLDEVKKLSQNADIEMKKAEKSLNSERRTAQDTVEGTVRQRRDELEESYDLEINKLGDRLRKVRSSREKAKNEGVRSRIDEETAELRARNKDLDVHMKHVFKENHVPGFCRTGLYYSLFNPKGISEILIMLLVFVIAFGALPFGIYLLFPEGGRKPFVLALIYVVLIAVFVGLYILINNKTRVRSAEVIAEGRRMRNAMKKNRREISRISRGIRKDKDEERYGLGGFDAEIQDIESQISELRSKKEQALTVFENETKGVISEEIMGNYTARLQELSDQFEEKNAEYTALETEAKELSVKLTEEYEVYVGKGNLNPERLQALIEIFQNESLGITNISEAVEYYKANR